MKLLRKNDAAGQESYSDQIRRLLPKMHETIQVQELEHPPKTNATMKIRHLKMYFLSGKMVIFECHVSF